MNESDFENELRGLRPALPSPSLEGRIAAALPSSAPATSRRPALALWLAERLLWATAGALAAWFLIVQVSPTPSPASAPWHTPNQPLVAQAKNEEPVARVSDEALAWSDDGVQLIDGETPARMLRRFVMERHRSTDGLTEIRVPREDVFLVPVSLH